MTSILWNNQDLHFRDKAQSLIDSHSWSVEEPRSVPLQLCCWSPSVLPSKGWNTPSFTSHLGSWVLERYSPQTQSQFHNVVLLAVLSCWITVHGSLLLCKIGILIIPTATRVVGGTAWKYIRKGKVSSLEVLQLYQLSVNVNSVYVEMISCVVGYF